MEETSVPFFFTTSVPNNFYCEKYQQIIHKQISTAPEDVAGI